MTLAKLFEYIENGIFVVFFFGFCIFIHEFGHLIVALWRKLHVESFSVGFGKALYRYRYKGVDYLISMIPFGGYVRLPQLDPGDEPQTSDGKPLPPAKPLDRILVAMAGPLFNVLFGFALGVVVWIVGVPGPAPSDSFVIDRIQEAYTNAEGITVPTPEYAAGLRAGDKVVGINGEKLKSGFSDVVDRILYATDPRVTLQTVRDGQPREIAYELAYNPDVKGKWFPFFEPKQSVKCRVVYENRGAYEAGIRPGDALVRIDGEEVTSRAIVIDRVKSSKGQPLSITVDREGQLLTFDKVVPRLDTVDGETKYVIGVEMADMAILKPTPLAQFTNTLTMTWKTLRSLVNPKNPINLGDMSGPVGIAHAMSISFLVDFMVGIQLVVLITFSLAIVNLLPLPVLDGGHISYGLIEVVTRRKIPSRVVWGLQNVFAVLIISFALYITFFDISRLIGPFGSPAPEPPPATATQPAAEPPAPAVPETP